MKNLRKLSFIVCLTFLCTIGFLNPVSAASVSNDSIDSPKVRVLQEKIEITDNQLLLQRALNNISDIQHNRKIMHVTNEFGNKLQVNIVKTSQQLQSYILEDKTKVDRYVTTQFTLATEPLPYPIPDDRDEQAWSDPMMGVKAYSTIYWNRYTRSDGYTFVKLTSVSGGWEIQDSSYSVTNRTIKMHQQGQGWSGNPRSLTTPSISVPLTYTKYPPSTSEWQDPVYTASYSYIGSTSYATVTRGSQTWQLTLANNTSN